MATKKSSTGKKKVHKVMSEYKHGVLHSGSSTGPIVTKRPQAIAIALNEQRQQAPKQASVPQPHKLTHPGRNLKTYIHDKKG